MKDLVEVLLRGLASFLPLLFSVIAAPKTTILREVSGVDSPVPKAVTFAGLSLVIGFLLQAPFAGDAGRLASSVGSMVALYVVTLSLGGAVIMLAFRVVGGRAPFESNLSSYLYLAGPLYLAMVILNLMIVGMIAARDPALARGWRLGNPLPEEFIDATIIQDPVTAGMLLVVAVVQLAVIFVWPFLCWGAFREINGVSRLRSAVAWFLALLGFLVVLTPMTKAMLRALGDGNLPPIL